MLGGFVTSLLQRVAGTDDAGVLEVAHVFCDVQKLKTFASIFFMLHSAAYARGHQGGCIGSTGVFLCQRDISIIGWTVAGLV